MFKGHKILLLLLLLVILIPSLAQAGFLEGGALSTLSAVDAAMAKFLYFAVYLIGYLAAIVFMIAGFLIQVGLELNANLINSPLVQVGWQISRDFANLLLVVAIITAAIGTIIRLQGYTYKNLLPKIIIVALLINFSLSIAGVFIDATGVVSNFFVTKSTPNASHGDFSEFSKSLAHALGLQEAMKTDTLEGEAAEFTESADFQFGKASLQLLAALFFVVAFTVLGGGTMMILSLSVLVRYIALSLLLIMLPLALISSAIPKFKKNWEEWQGKFIEYLAFLPVSLFFIYLTIIFLTNFKTHPSGVFGVISGSGGNVSDFIANIAETGARLSIVIGLLLGNLIISKKISSSAKDMVENSSLALYNRFKGRTKKIGKGFAKLPLRAGKAGLGAAGSGLARMPGIRRFTSSYRADADSKKRADRKKQVDSYQNEKLKGLNNTELYGYSELGATAKAAKLNELSKRGQLDDFLDKRGGDREAAIKPFVNSAKKMNSKEEALKTMPSLAGEFVEGTENVAEAIRKATGKIPAKEIVNIATSELRKVEVAMGLTKNQLKELARSPQTEKKQVLQSTINQHLEIKMPEVRRRESPGIREDLISMAPGGKEYKELKELKDYINGPSFS